MSYIVEVLLPNNDSKQYEFTERYTIDAIKKEIFKQTEELANFKKEDFELGISEEERLSIEFYKLLGYKGHFKERADQGLPIMLGLYKKQTPLTPIKFQKSLSSSLSSSSISPIILQQSSSPSLSKSQQNINVRNSFSDIQKLQLSLSSIDILKIQRNSVNHQIPNFGSTLGEEKHKEQEEGNSLSSSTSSAESPRGLSTSAPIVGSPISSMSPGSPTTTRTRSSSRSIKALFTKSAKSSSDLDIGSHSPNNNNNNMGGKGVKEEMSATDLSAMLMARDDWASSEEMKMIAQNQFGFHFEIGLNSMKAEQFNLDIFVLEIPKQENLFEKYFLNSDHKNYAGEVEGIGPVFISVLKDKQKGHTRALIRVPQQTFHLCVEHTAASSSKSLKAILAKHNQKINQKSLKCIKSPDLVKELEKFDNSHVVKTFKFGALYCKDGQTTEEEWFSNEHGSKEFYEFLDLIGDRITLNGWKKFRGGLDVNGNSTGTESYYTTHTDFEIMFHVSTLLPYFEADEQKIERKRHLGNDIVVIIYKEGSTLFPPSICKSVFNHTYIVVSKENDNYYRVELTIKDGVKPFGPPFPFPGLIHKDLIGEFLLVKMMNAEWAAYKSLEFSHKFKRTRNLQLSTLLEKFSV